MKTLIVALVAVVVGTFVGYSWSRYKDERRWREEAISSLERTRKWAEGEQAFIAIRQKELECAGKRTSNGNSLPHAILVCHQLHSLEWVNWAKAYPDLAKQQVEDRAIVQATQ